MSVPTQITWRGMEPSAALEVRIRELVQRLEKFSSQMIRCQVVVELPHKHRHQARAYEIRIQMTSPGAQLNVQHEHHARHSHEDPYVAVRDAFRAARRQLEDYERIRRGDVKHHTSEPTAVEEDRESR